ncbi:hypothetical protein E2562_029318 [Oryza meyeriana var. granulata]|uniref:Uncharacterized protein n=1 Tax=Oryza meyeriana var. granulata TaxID=110450 RepID=A0A6G1E3W7_9ORYZ|nr:hypothetical protein E2562_029318 [Oryza meyeriana var. granulata]
MSHRRNTNEEAPPPTNYNYNAPQPHVSQQVGGLANGQPVTGEPPRNVPTADERIAAVGIVLMQYQTNNVLIVK